MRHGELRQLRNLKREFHQSAPRKKKILKLNEGDYLAENEDLEENEIDIRDVEFRLRNDARQVKVSCRYAFLFAFCFVLNL